MKIKAALALLGLAFLNGCSPLITKTSTPPPTNSIVPSPSPSPTMEMRYELASVIKQTDNSYSVYSSQIGCLDLTPCVESSTKMFQEPFDIYNLSWSPDGHSLAFSGENQRGAFDIYVSTNDGKTITNITNTIDYKDLYPSWSSDGSKIAYLSTHAIKLPRLLISSPDGSDATQILNNVANPYQVVWSRQGMLAYSAFVSDQDIRYQIRVLNQDDSLYWLIPFNTDDSVSGNVLGSFSPDGNFLVYMGDIHKSGKIYLADLRTKTVRNLSPSEVPCDESYPSWSPDGQWIAFLSTCGGQVSSNYQIVFLNVSQNRRAVINLEIDGVIYYVTWRP